MSDTPGNASFPVIPLRRMFDLGVAAGASAGALVALLDWSVGGGVASLGQSTLLVLMIAVVGVAVWLPLTLAAGLLRHLAWRRLPESVWAAILWGLAVQLALTLCLEDYRLLASVPLPWLVAAAAWRLGRKSPLRRQTLLALPLIALVAVILRLGNTPTEWVSNHLPPASAPAITAPLKPNIVLIVLDTTRADRLGCYGSTARLTPNLDAFAAEATVYQDSYATGPWTLPSHASLFTGLHTHSHGCDNEPHRWLDDGFPTLPEMLAPHGYQSAAIVANEFLESSNLLKGFDRYFMLAGRRESDPIFKWIARAGWPAAWADHGGAEGAEQFADWLHAGRDPHKPFLLFVNLMETHWPHHAPLTERLAHLPPGVGYLEALRVASRYYGIRWLAGQRHTPRDEQIIRALYDAETAYQDRIVGRMLDALRAAVDMDKTLVIITSDHGENLGDAGRWDHMFALNDALIHVPLVIRYPGGIGRHERIKGLNQLVSIVPTIFDLLGVPAPVAGLPGATLLPGRFRPLDFVLAEAAPFYGHLERMESVVGLERDVHEFSAHLRALRGERYKLVWPSHGEPQLFDLEHDPNESANVIGQHPDIAARMKSRLDAAGALQPYRPRPGIRRGPRHGNVDKIRGIGYF